MKHARLIVLALLVVALAALPGCLSDGHHGRTHTSQQGLQATTNTDTVTHELPDTAEKFSLSIEIMADAGTFKWELTDPNGVAQWEGRADAGQKVKETRPLDLIVGEWSLDIRMENAGGSYDIEFISR